MSLDEGLRQVGQLGRFQLKVYCLLVAAMTFSAYFSLAYVFTAAHPPYRCFVEMCDREGANYWTPWLNKAIPTENGKPDSCHYYKPTNSSCVAFYTNRTVSSCHRYVFETNTISIMNSFDLYCRDKLWMLTIVGTLNNVGQFVGMITAGFLSDRLGRKTVLVGNLVGSSLAGTLKSFAPNYYVFLVLEFLDAFLGMGIYSGALIIGGEYAGPEQRSRAVSVLSCSYTLGEVVLGLAAWFIPDWRVLLRVLYIPGFLYLSYIWLLPESMRWLVTKGRKDEALAIFESIEKTNNSFVPELTKKNLFKQIEADVPPQSDETGGEAAGKSALRQILGSSSMLIRVIACSYVWIAHTLLFYGLSLFSVSVAGNSYVNFLLVSLAEVPAYVIAAALMKVASRRATLALCLFISATACVSFHWVPSGNVVVGQCLFFLSKCGVTASFTVLYVFTMEMFPTTLRHTLLGFCSMFGRIGSMIAPQAPLLAYYVDPLLVFGGAAYLATLLILIFPETADKILPDNVKQAQDIGRVDPTSTT